MTTTRLAPELERRIEQVDREAQTSPKLATKDWLFLLLAGWSFRCCC